MFGQIEFTIRGTPIRITKGAVILIVACLALISYGGYDYVQQSASHQPGVLYSFSDNQITANRMTPATPVTNRDEIKPASSGFVYKRPAAVLRMFAVTENDGPDGI